MDRNKFKYLANIKQPLYMENLNSKYIGTNNIQFGLQDPWGKIWGGEITVKRIIELCSASLSANQQSFETSVVFSV